MSKTVVNAIGTTEYYNNEGELYREEGPNGYEAWYMHGLLHREDGPAATYINGNKVWYINGFLHREDGPAVEYANGDQSWYMRGKIHREDGPAIIYGESKHWYYHDHSIDCKTQEEFERLIKLELFW